MKISIIRECSEFLKISEGLPLMKFLPSEGSDQRKVKVRKKRSLTQFGEIFNEVFDETPDIHQRCIKSSGKLDSGYRPLMHELFYIFPINGFKFMFSPNVNNSEFEYDQRLRELTDATYEGKGRELLKEVLMFEYAQGTDLSTGIRNGDEIIIYGIPFYYAIKASSVNSYSTLFSL